MHFVSFAMKFRPRHAFGSLLAVTPMTSPDRRQTWGMKRCAVEKMEIKKPHATLFVWHKAFVRSSNSSLKPYFWSGREDLNLRPLQPH